MALQWHLKYTDCRCYYWKCAGTRTVQYSTVPAAVGGAAAQRRQKQIWKEYRDKMRQKDREHFGIQEGGKGPLESIFSQSDFQGLAVGTYGEISSNVRKMVSIAVEYGYKHLGGSILASDLDAVKNSIRRRFHTTIAMASWRGYANMLLGRIQYVGIWEGLCLQQSPEAVSPRGALGPGGLWFLVMCTLD